ncbi:MAG: tRNA (N6-isopentenyl adenosine(37)-C2)-methylthiotransferase MiaB [Pseudomonadota bacterium]|jgi:tRNA-2-methylthio-N6-dimethylallyladenosine synthase
MSDTPPKNPERDITEGAAPKQRVYIRTYGCQMNEYDTQKLYKILEKDYQPVETPDKADLVLVNTCSIRDKSEQKLYSVLGELKGIKAERPGMMVGVCGCVAQQEGENILKYGRGVDFVFGTHNLSLVPSLIQLRKNGAPPQVAVDYREEWEELPLGFAENDPTRNGQKQHVTAFVSISRGCNKNCTYCIVPTTRGPEVSRAVDEIEREVRIAVHRGSKEIVLLGQTVNSYGRDLSPRISFVELLERVARIDGVERIRFTSPHPQEVRQDFIDCVVSNPKVCRHIHMPLQSGSNSILKAMNRNYHREKYLSIIKQLKERVPDIAITTDIIVGFPGETEADFEQTLEVMDIVQFDNSYSFAFSARPGTVAAELKETLTQDQKLERLRILQAKQEQIMARRLEAWVGREAQVLIDSHNQRREDCAQGRISQGFMVNFEQSYQNVQLGFLVNARITGRKRFTLVAEPVEREKSI